MISHWKNFITTAPKLHQTNGKESQRCDSSSELKQGSLPRNSAVVAEDDGWTGTMLPFARGWINTVVSAAVERLPRRRWWSRAVIIEDRSGARGQRGVPTSQKPPRLNVLVLRIGIFARSRCGNGHEFEDQNSSEDGCKYKTPRTSQWTHTEILCRSSSLNSLVSTRFCSPSDLETLTFSSLFICRWVHHDLSRWSYSSF